MGLAKQPKAHHFVPVAHLARFSSSPDSMPFRDRMLHVYDKRSGLFRSAKARNVAYQNDLYTIRTPDLADLQPDLQQLLSTVFDPGNKDAEVEAAKIDMEARGLAAMQELERWEVGPRKVPDDQKAALVTYIGLLLAQHPTMMDARSRAIRQKFRAATAPRFKSPAPLRAIFDEFSSGAGVLALGMDAFASAFELDYLGWTVIRWPNGPHLILGDVGVAVRYPLDPLGLGHPWSEGAMFLLPVGPTTLLIIGGLAPGTCVVESRVGGDTASEIAAINSVSWARARSEVYGAQREDLERTLAVLGPEDRSVGHSMQVEVRTSVLPDFIVEADGQLEIVQPPDPSPEETATRFAARFLTAQDGSQRP